MVQEFFAQGDRERERGLPVSPLGAPPPGRAFDHSLTAGLTTV